MDNDGGNETIGECPTNDHNNLTNIDKPVCSLFIDICKVTLYLSLFENFKMVLEFFQ